jgi:amidohydrolase
MNPLKIRINKLVETLYPQLVEMRRHFHKHPELSFEEAHTSKTLQELLTKAGLNYSTGWCKHGIVGLIEGNNPQSRIIALRADMDGLPITETNDIAYKSVHEGIMHACGHDVHMTCLLGALMVLQNLKAELEGTIKFIFQPAEEKLPGGASILIQEGVLDNPKPGLIIGQHVQVGMPVGRIGLNHGAFMASSDEIYIKVIGKGGHAAQPQLCIDPVYIASQLIISLQALISREKQASIPSVLSFGKIETEGGATNVIPDIVNIEGTFRSLDETWRKHAHQRMNEICDHVSKAFNAVCSLEIRKGYPCLINDSVQTSRLTEFAENYLGTDHVELMEARLTSEDFAYYSQEIPAVFYRLGVGNSSGVHTSTFNIDESAIKTGSGLMAYLAMKM